MLDVLPKSPEDIDNISILISALHKLQDLERIYGREYVFEDIQELHLGGTCRPIPRDLPQRENNSTYILGTYDKQFLIDRINFLQHC